VTIVTIYTGLLYGDVNETTYIPNYLVVLLIRDCLRDCDNYFLHICILSPNVKKVSSTHNTVDQFLLPVRQSQISQIIDDRISFHLPPMAAASDAHTQKSANYSHSLSISFLYNEPASQISHLLSFPVLTVVLLSFRPRQQASDFS
jgi:hypothetical protein